MTYDTYDIILMGRGKFNICVHLKDKLVHTHQITPSLSLVSLFKKSVVILRYIFIFLGSVKLL